MRVRTLVIVLALLALTALAVLNLGELLRPTELNLGWRSIEAPAGLLWAALAAGALLAALLSIAYDQHVLHKERHELERQLQAQRDLADRAEGSRLAEVQRHLDLQAQAAQHREREMTAQMSERLEQAQRSLQRQLDDVGNTLAAYIGEVEDRLERRRLLRPLEEDKTPPYDRH